MGLTFVTPIVAVKSAWKHIICSHHPIRISSKIQIICMSNVLFFGSVLAWREHFDAPLYTDTLFMHILFTSLFIFGWFSTTDKSIWIGRGEKMVGRKHCPLTNETEIFLIYAFNTLYSCYLHFILPGILFYSIIIFWRWRWDHMELRFCFFSSEKRKCLTKY